MSNATIRRGVLLLELQSFRILGGYVARMNEEDPLVRLEKKFKTMLKCVHSKCGMN